MEHLIGCRELIEQQPDNYRYHSSLRESMALPVDGLSGDSVTSDEREQLRKLYAGLQTQHPKSSAAFRVPLDYEVRVPKRTRCSETSELIISLSLGQASTRYEVQTDRLRNG